MARTLRLVVEYDGTGLSGFQRQNNAPTVQEHLERALARMTQEPTPLVGASRTDAGVHAEGQVCHFRTRAQIPPHGFRRGMNSYLPEQIAVLDCTQAPADFHARFSAIGKRYRYQLLVRDSRSPLLRHRSWHRRAELDLTAMGEAADLLLGEHDFRAFRATGCGAKTTQRRIDAIDIQASGAVVTIEVRGNAFLRNMVRIFAGTLVEVGEGRRPIDDVRAALAGGERERAGQTAPPQGLTLVEVLYPATA